MPGDDDRGSSSAPQSLLSRIKTALPLRPPSTSSAEESVSSTGSSTDDESEAQTPALVSISAPSLWGGLPARYKIITGNMMAFIICNLDKVVMSVCIVPMAQDFGWSSSIAGLVQSSFFWGYLLVQLPGGTIIKRIGGRKVLPVGVAGFSLATAVLPLVASTVPGLCLSRAIVGAGESIAPSAATDMVARIVPSSERSRAVSFIFSGLHLGSILGLLAGPALIAQVEWEAVFVCFGVVGLVWTLWFEQMMAKLAETDPDIVFALENDVPSGSTLSSRNSNGKGRTPIPWRAFLRNRSVQALMFTHFCNNWLHYSFMAWLPTYFIDMLSVDLMHAAHTALLPPIAGIAASAVAGPLADELISRDVPVAVVRKAAQCIAFLAPTACLLSTFNPDITASTSLTVACITAALGISSFSLAGLYCTHQDLSPRYASTLLGLTNTAGAVPGIVGVTVVGYIFDATNSWELSLMLPSAVFLTAGAIVYCLLGTHEQIDFDEEDDSPFGFEKWLPLKFLASRDN